MRGWILCLLLGLCGCNGCGQIANDDGGVDASTDAPSEASADGASGDSMMGDANVCDPNRPLLPQNENCDANLDAICQQWAQSAAIGSYGSSVCVFGQTGSNFCGDPDCNGYCCGTDPQCGIGQVCASDTPSGPRHCIQACSGL